MDKQAFLQALVPAPLAHERTYGLIRRGELRSLKIGGARRVAVADIEEFVRRLREGVAEGADE